jgi:hypothetical protein
MSVRGDTRERAQVLLEQMLGAEAEFRLGQLEAIETVVDERSRVLVVQRTGWGKSLVYFLATRLLRDAGFGPTLLISPLLSLMRDQLLMAQRIGVRADTINSENADEWDAVEDALAADEIDLLLVSPERLANAQFAERTLALIPRSPRGLEFLFSRNRLNVAVSRARCLAYVVASPRLLEADCKTVEKMRLVNALCRFVEVAA